MPENRQQQRISEARNWLADCDFDASDLPDSEVVAIVNRQYDGGWRGFVTDSCEFSEVSE